MTMTPSQPTFSPAPPRILALHRHGDPQSRGDGQQSRRAFDRQQEEQRIRQLQAMCVLSPELSWITSQSQRHWQRGTYQRDTLVSSLQRFVVEPAAIELTAARPGQHLPWFRAYPPALREQLAHRLALVVEQDIGITASPLVPGEVDA